MRIGELADRLELNPRTLRFYETVGLLPEPDRTPSGYRDYSEDDLERVRFIKSAQRLGLSLEDIKEILAFKDRGRPAVRLCAVGHRQGGPTLLARRSPSCRHCATTSGH